MASVPDSVLVTGGAGFIGSNFARLALERGSARVAVIDKLTYAGSTETVEDLSGDPRFHFVQADIGDRAAVAGLLAEHRPTAVVNFAAETHVDRSIDDPRAFVDTNLVGTFSLLEAVRAYWSGLTGQAAAGFRFLHVSTDEVYGSLDAEGAFSETTPYAPNSPYSATKAGADHLVRAWNVTYGLPTLVTCCSNNYGPYQFPEKLIPLSILNAVEGKSLPIYGDGQHVREWIFVEDHCTALLRVLEGGRLGERYNVGGSVELPNLELIRRLCAQLEQARPARDNPALASQGLERYDQLVTFVEDRPGHDRRYAMDDARLRGELGWRPAHDLDAGLARTVRWYLAHRDWCQSVQAGNYGRQRLGLARSADG